MKRYKQSSSRCKSQTLHHKKLMVELSINGLQVKLVALRQCKSKRLGAALKSEPAADKERLMAPIRAGRFAVFGNRDGLEAFTMTGTKVMPPGVDANFDPMALDMQAWKRAKKPPSKKSRWMVSITTPCMQRVQC